MSPSARAEALATHLTVVVVVVVVVVVIVVALVVALTGSGCTNIRTQACAMHMRGHVHGAMRVSMFVHMYRMKQQERTGMIYIRIHVRLKRFNFDFDPSDKGCPTVQAYKRTSTHGHVFATNHSTSSRHRRRRRRS